MTNSKKVRTRIAPSPTGSLHVGTIRAALFSWLYARKNGGEFVVRIEDTDKERSDKKYEEEILEGLAWVGIDWDEGPYRQSERRSIYKKEIQKLLDNKLAYFNALEKSKEGKLKNYYHFILEQANKTYGYFLEFIKKY